jgi:hypothetical protein
MFLLLNQDGNHEVTAEEFCTLASVADAEDETFKYELLRQLQPLVEIKPYKH